MKNIKNFIVITFTQFCFFISAMQPQIDLNSQDGSKTQILMEPSQKENTSISERIIGLDLQDEKIPVKNKSVVIQSSSLLSLSEDTEDANDSDSKDATDSDGALTNKVKKLEIFDIQTIDETQETTAEQCMPDIHSVAAFQSITHDRSPLPSSLATLKDDHPIPPKIPVQKEIATTPEQAITDIPSVFNFQSIANNRNADNISLPQSSVSHLNPNYLPKPGNANQRKGTNFNTNCMNNNSFNQANQAIANNSTTFIDDVNHGENGENICQLFNSLSKEAQASILLADLRFLSEETEGIPNWQRRDVLIPIVDPQGNHKYWNFLRFTRSTTNISAWLLDIVGIIFPPLSSAFPDKISKRASTAVMTCIGAGKMIFSALKSHSEAVVKEESRKIFFKVIHNWQEKMIHNNELNDMITNTI